MTESETNNDRKGDDETMETSSNDPMLRAHRRTYQSFMKLLAWSAGAIALVLILMALFLV